MKSDKSFDVKGLGLNIGLTMLCNSCIAALHKERFSGGLELHIWASALDPKRA